VGARTRELVGFDRATFAHDGHRHDVYKGCPGARFQMLRRELGQRFEGIEIDSSPGNPYRIPAR
jgi:hypothetical protein